MAKCDQCGTTILFGAVREGDFTYCGENCREKGITHRVVQHLPDEVLEDAVAEVHQGDCPKCGGPGPVDMHTSHRVWSIIALTSWSDHPQLCCRSCAVKAKLFSMAFSGALGWWGFPFGLIMTPVQIGRNLFGLVSGPDPEVPSAELRKLVSLQVGANVLQEVERRRQQPPSAESPVFEE